jgi:RNA polymerase sigma-70 factor (ECF subfamily)
MNPCVPLDDHVPHLLALARRLLPADLRAKASASDLVQETCLLAHRSLHQFRGATAAEFRAWLTEILRRVARDHRRRTSAEVPLDAGSHDRLVEALAAAGPTPASEAGRRELLDAIRRELAALPDDERQAFLWRVEEQLSYAEIGRRLGCSENTAARTFGRAVLTLKLRLGALS